MNCGKNYAKPKKGGKLNIDNGIHFGQARIFTLEVLYLENLRAEFSR